MTPTTPTRPPRHDPAPGWSHCLATGAPGIALLHIEYARTGTGAWHTAHQWAAAMTRSPVPAHPGVCSLYQGAPALAFTLHAAGQPAYTKALNTLDSHITTLTRHRLGQARQRIDSGRLPALREFDLISGLTGIAAYLLYRHGGGYLLREALSYLVRLTQPLAVHGEALPGWWCGTGPGGHPSPRWPGGHGNLGVAHGISGPLALLSTAMRHGVTVTGQAEAIGRICAWLDQWRVGDGKQVWWPEMISLPESRSHVARQAGPGRPSWCYGTPGLARAQQLAALALADTQRRRLAEQALAGCIADGRQLSQLGDASLCHGWAGVVQATWRAATDAGPDTELTARLPNLRSRLSEHLQRQPPDHAGLLEGMAGVLLAQHTTAASDAPATRWDACLLLDG